MPTTLLRRLTLAVSLLLGALGAAALPAHAVNAPTAPETTDPLITTTTVARSTPRPADPDDGFQPEDVADWVKDNVAPIIVVAGLVLLVVLWKYVTRPSRTKF
jgi:hypothetical protein